LSLSYCNLKVAQDGRMKIKRRTINVCNDFFILNLKFQYFKKLFLEQFVVKNL
jgi:hypothetical protein